MRRFGLVLIFPVMILLGVSGTPAQVPVPVECQYLHVVDPCGKELLIFGVGSYVLGHSIPLDGGDAGQHAPGGVDFTTIPGYGASYSFVAQGPFLRVINHDLDEPRSTVDIAQETGLPEVSLLRVHAASPIEIGGETLYPLYAIGSRAGAPWLLVLDQVALLARDPVPGSLLLSSGPLCPDGEECAGVGVDVAANYPLLGLGVQEAYASVLSEIDGQTRQRFYRVTLFEDLSFEVLLEPWNDEAQPFAGSMPLALGVDYDLFRVSAHGVFQTSGVAANLSSGEASCPLAGDPVDLELWGVNIVNGGAGPYYFVTSHDPGGPDRVSAFPVGECPGGSPASIEVPVGEVARAMAINSQTSLSPWIYTVGTPAVGAVRLGFVETGRGTRIEVLGSLEVPVEGACPFEITMRDPAYWECSPAISQDPKPPPVRCEEDPDDLACVERNKPSEFGEN